MRELDTNNHSVFAMYYHLVLVVKYRRKVIDDNISARLQEIFKNIQGKYNITLLEWNPDVDHVHILFKAHPNTEISKRCRPCSYIIQSTSKYRNK